MKSKKTQNHFLSFTLIFAYSSLCALGSYCKSTGVAEEDEWGKTNKQKKNLINNFIVIIQKHKLPLDVTLYWQSVKNDKDHLFDSIGFEYSLI